MVEVVVVPVLEVTLPIADSVSFAFEGAAAFNTRVRILENYNVSVA